MVGLVAGLIISGLGPFSTQANVMLAEEADEPTVIDLEELEVVDVSVDDDAVLGDPNAPITIVEYSDYQCPFCARFVNETMPMIVENFVDTGVAKIVFRDYPLPTHAAGALAAEAAECVGKNGDAAYFEMHDALFADSSWAYGEDEVQVEASLVELADGLGYDIASCLMNNEMAQEVADDFTAARAYGVSGTPTFFVNGSKLVGAWPYEVFEGLIQYRLDLLEQ